MGIAIASLIFAVLTLFAVSLRKTYQYLPQKELKRRSREGDELARGLYKAVAYGYSLDVLLWILIGICAAGFFLTSAWVWPAWFALFVSATLIWLGFYWIPTSRVTDFGRRTAGYVAPAFAWALHYLHPVIDWCVAFVRRHRPVHFHTGLYDKEDLLDLLVFQRRQADSRIDTTELLIAEHALTFGDLHVRDILTPRRVVKTVNVEETVGPVLLSSLHDSGFSRFPVYEERADNIVGTLFLRDVTHSKQGGTVRELMRPNRVCYVHEEQPLTEALQAILKTHRHLMIVVNSFEEYVGIITIEDVLEQIIGKPIVDEFDEYEDMRAVAQKMAAKDHKAHIDHTATKDATEVVE